ncbi:hypothetical protein [Listeria innocua]|uniref:hypothetical protein n=1 Tax=Listeria innocua TaxID=1642 RepID=UPI00162AA7AC|nr:hypothetical protein [Listeria innocua]MBC1925562.1 hypothetical protein [Listeria innocua]
MIDENLLLSQPVKKNKEKKLGKQKKFKRGKQQPSVLASLFPIRIEEELVVTREGVTDIFRLENFAIRKEPHQTQQEAIQSLIYLFRGVKADVKIFLETFDVATQSQQQFLKARARLSELAPEGEELSTVYLRELEMSEQNMPQNIVYFQLFARDEAELNRAKLDVDISSSIYTTVHALSVSEKKTFLHELHNIGAKAPKMTDEISQKAHLNKRGEDIEFMQSIQPEGGIRKKGDYFLQTSRGYLGCLKLHEWSTKFDFFYGGRIFRHANVLTMIDISHREKSEVLSGMNNTLNDKRHSKPKDEVDKKQLQKETQLLDGILEDVVNGNEQVKEVMVRYYLTGKTKESIWSQAEDINSRLQPMGYKASFFVTDEKSDWQALFSPLTEQKYRRRGKGKEMTTSDLGCSYFLDHSQLIDPKGLYLGFTNTNGLVLFDMYHKDKQRKSYNFSLLGIMGSGKSTSAKKLIAMNQVLRNYDYIFAVNKEYDRLAQAFQGITFDVSGVDGAVNPWQIFATAINEENNQVDEEGSLAIATTKIITIFRTLAEDKQATYFKYLKGYIKRFYEDYFQKHELELKKCTQYQALDYPLSEDFYAYISALYSLSGSQSKVEENERVALFDLMKFMEDELLDSNAKMFNRHTTFVFEDNHMVVFNFERLLQQSSKVFGGQLFNLFFLTWNLCMKRGMREKYLVETGQKTLDEVIYSRITFEEFHNITRQREEATIDLIDRYIREARKAFGSLGLISQDITDLLPNGSQDPFDAKVSKLLKLSQYIFVMQQSPSSQKALQETFGETLRESELQAIPRLEEGQGILCIVGQSNYTLKVDVTEMEKALFRGGI